jgi:hypothetical protein
MIDLEVERVCRELTEQKNPSGVEAVLKVALYYTEKLATASAGKTFDKPVASSPPVKIEKASPEKLPVKDSDDELNAALAEAEKSIGIN